MGSLPMYEKPPHQDGDFQHIGRLLAFAHEYIYNPFVHIIVPERWEMASPKRTLPGKPGSVQNGDCPELGSCVAVVSAMTAVMIMVMGTMMTTMFPLSFRFKANIPCEFLFRNA